MLLVLRNDNAQYLKSTSYFNYDHPLVADFIRVALKGVNQNPCDQAIALYLHTRDSIRYNPYVFESVEHSFSASFVLEKKESYCVPKAVLLGAAARAIGIPSRLGLADVKNHLSSPQLIQFLQTDLFSMHGYIELFINGRWVKATPAFNAALCEKMHVEPLDFNGVDDSIFQASTESGDRHMEYINDHGTFSDVPFDFILRNLQHHYPHLFDEKGVRTFSYYTKSNLDQEISIS